MSCCGKSRAQMPRVTTPTYIPTLAGTVTFQYTGKTRLTVIGPITRNRYDFDRPGARASVDRRDSNSLATVATLKRI
jgi:hypothetical protein